VDSPSPAIIFQVLKQFSADIALLLAMDDRYVLHFIFHCISESHNNETKEYVLNAIVPALDHLFGIRFDRMKKILRY
jgi:hypothetical protein